MVLYAQSVPYPAANFLLKEHGISLNTLGAGYIKNRLKFDDNRRRSTVCLSRSQKDGVVTKLSK
jgi:hypothetical protein